MLPIVIRTTEEMLRLVPARAARGQLRARAAGKARTIRTVVLPHAAPGIVSGALLAVARAAGETAPLLFTIGVVDDDELEPVRRPEHRAVGPDLQQRRRRRSPGAQDRAWGAALTLILIVFIFTSSPAS